MKCSETDVHRCCIILIKLCEKTNNQATETKKTKTKMEKYLFMCLIMCEWFGLMNGMVDIYIFFKNEICSAKTISPLPSSTTINQFFYIYS